MRNYPLLVQKYGGTSIGTAERMLSVGNIVKSTLKTCRVMVVLSAMSSYKKAEGTTSRLLFAAAEVLKPNSTAYLQVVDKIEEDHISTVEKVIPQGQILEQAIKDIISECQKLRSFLSAAEVGYAICILMRVKSLNLKSLLYH